MGARHSDIFLVENGVLAMVLASVVRMMPSAGPASPERRSRESARSSGWLADGGPGCPRPGG